MRYPSQLVRHLSTAVLLVCALTMRAQTQNRTAPDVIFVHGNIYTGAVFEPAPDGGLRTRVLQRAQALAVKDQRIIAVGTDAQIRKLKDKHTQEVDLGGRFVMPGFNDAHMHLAAGGMEKLTIQLFD